MLLVCDIYGVNMNVKLTDCTCSLCSGIINLAPLIRFPSASKPQPAYSFATESNYGRVTSPTSDCFLDRLPRRFCAAGKGEPAG